MPLRPKFGRFAIVALLSLGAAPSAMAQVPADLGDLVGARGSSGETQMEARGYAFIKTVTAQGKKWSYWWGASQGQCVQIATDDGRYAAINALPPQNCGKAGPDAGASRDGGPSPLADGGRGSLTLICYGEGRKPAVESRRGYAWNNDKRDFEPTYG